jgi:hypothetical protein
MVPGLLVEEAAFSLAYVFGPFVNDQIAVIVGLIGKVGCTNITHATTTVEGTSHRTCGQCNIWGSSLSKTLGDDSPLVACPMPYCIVNASQKEPSSSTKTCFFCVLLLEHMVSSATRIHCPVWACKQMY